MGLTEQQALAAANRGGNLLVSAAAGSGKTKVLVERLMLYLTDSNDPANIDDFLIITYTRAAASELRSKIADELNERIAANPENRRLRNQLQRLYLAKISTIHSFCADLLKEQAYRLDIPGDFRIAEEEEGQILRQQVLQRVLEDAYSSDEMDSDFQAFIDSQEIGRGDDNLSKIILNLYDSAVCHSQPTAWLNKCLQEFDVTAKSDCTDTIWGRYLLDDLQKYVSLHLEAMSKCAADAQGVTESAKPITVFENDIAWLRRLQGCKTWDDVIQHKDHTFDRLAFSKKFGDAALQEQMKAIRAALKSGILGRLERFKQTSNELLPQLTAILPAARGLIHLVEAFMDAYARKKRQLRIMDYSDLEHKTYALLVRGPNYAPTALANELSHRFREIMVDEFQDSNEVQDGIFQAITCQKHNCFMVGDVKQSIYQFRLADPEIFLNKFMAFPDAVDAQDGEGRKVLLSMNFRSSVGVIEAVNHVCNLCMSPEVGGVAYTDEERLYAGRGDVNCGEPEVSFYAIDVAEDTYQEEATFVANKILELTDGTHYIADKDGKRPITFDDIAIILRSPGSVGMEFASALQKCGIPSYIGKGSNLLLTEEVATLRSFLQTISNPLLDIPLVATLTSRVFAFSAADLAQIRGDNRNISVFDSLCNSSLTKASAFVNKLNYLRQYARIHTLSDLILEIFRICNFDRIFAADRNGFERTENLQTFCKLLSNYESTGHRTLDQLLDHLSALEEKGIAANEGAKPSGSVEILSVHKSKGLEYPVVFLSGLSRSFNMTDASEQLLRHKHLGLGLSFVNREKRIRFPTIAKKAIAKRILSDNLSQEMLVLYVAMTRARDRLIMTYAVSNLQKQIADTVNQMDHSDPLLLTTTATCPGDWVLYAALHRTEAAPLYQMGGYPRRREVSDRPWHIEVVDGGTISAQMNLVEATPEKMPADAVLKISKSLAFSYPHQMATTIPSKLTATELKGRQLDEEVAENAKTVDKRRVHWKLPSDSDTGITYGTALHAVMQYVSYSACDCVENIQAELDRLVSENFISRDQADAVDIQSIAAFFKTDIGQMARNRKVLREFKFTVLQDSSAYFDGATGDMILLQGVIDLAILDDDGIIVVDFKTDRVSGDNLKSAAEAYFPQVRAYSKALEQIYRKPVTKSLLYFFRLGEFVDVM